MAETQYGHFLKKLNYVETNGEYMTMPLPSTAASGMRTPMASACYSRALTMITPIHSMRKSRYTWAKRAKSMSSILLPSLSCPRDSPTVP